MNVRGGQAVLPATAGPSSSGAARLQARCLRIETTTHAVERLTGRQPTSLADFLAPHRAALPAT